MFGQSKYAIPSTLLVFAFVIMAAPSAAKAGFVATATLLGANERPTPTASAGTGFATITFDSVLDTLMYDVLYSGLAGTATASHIHIGPVAGTGPVVLPFNPSPTGTAGELTGTLHNADIVNQGTTGLTDISQIAAQIQAGNGYVNVHSNLFPGGEIRGQLSVTAPEPGSLFLLGAGLLALACGRRFASRVVRS